jgi:hypothetical protein
MLKDRHHLIVPFLLLTQTQYRSFDRPPKRLSVPHRAVEIHPLEMSHEVGCFTVHCLVSEETIVIDVPIDCSVGYVVKKASEGTRKRGV